MKLQRWQWWALAITLAVITGYAIWYFTLKKEDTTVVETSDTGSASDTTTPTTTT